MFSLTCLKILTEGHHGFGASRTRIDVVAEVHLSVQLDFPDSPVRGRRSADLIVQHLRDKKVAVGKLRFVLVDRLGEASLYEDVKPEWIDAGLDSVLTS